MKKSHNWILLENPRNGKIQIKACSDCGTMKSLNAQVIVECKPREAVTRSLVGWKESAEAPLV